MPKPTRSLLVAVLPLLSAHWATAQSCYDSNGAQVAGGVFENSKKTWTACPGSKTCCLTGGESNDACFSGGMCWSDTGGAFYRGMCTEQNWADGGDGEEGCPSKCLDLHNDGNTWINACGDNWCCAGGAGSGNNCCSNSDAIFRHGTYTPLVASTSSSNSTTCTTNGDLSANQAAPTATVTATLTAAQTGYVKQSTAIGIGAGLGVSLLCALAALAFVLFQNRSRAKTGLSSTRPVLEKQHDSYGAMASTPDTQSSGATAVAARADGYSYISPASDQQMGYAPFDAGADRKHVAEMYSGSQRFEAPA